MPQGGRKAIVFCAGLCAALSTVLGGCARYQVFEMPQQEVPFYSYAPTTWHRWPSGGQVGQPAPMPYEAAPPEVMPLPAVNPAWPAPAPSYQPPNSPAPTSMYQQPVPTTPAYQQPVPTAPAYQLPAP